MRAPKAPVFTKEDLPDIPEKLMRPLNLFLGAVEKVLGSLSVGDNLTGQTADVTVDAATPVTGSFPIYVSLTIPKPRHVIITDAENQTTENATIPAIHPTWQVTGDGRLKLLAVSGLADGTKYRLRLLLLP